MNTAEKIEYRVMVGDWFRPELLFPVFGITINAAKKYRLEGKWLEDRHWRKDPANRIVYNREAIQKWMGGEM